MDASQKSVFNSPVKVWEYECLTSSRIASSILRPIYCLQAPSAYANLKYLEIEMIHF